MPQTLVDLKHGHGYVNVSCKDEDQPLMFVFLCVAVDSLVVSRTDEVSGGCSIHPSHCLIVVSLGLYVQTTGGVFAGWASHRDCRLPWTVLGGARWKSRAPDRLISSEISANPVSFIGAGGGRTSYQCRSTKTVNKKYRSRIQSFFVPLPLVLWPTRFWIPYIRNTT